MRTPKLTDCLAFRKLIVALANDGMDHAIPFAASPADMDRKMVDLIKRVQSLIQTRKTRSTLTAARNYRDYLLMNFDMGNRFTSS